MLPRPKWSAWHYFLHWVCLRVEQRWAKIAVPLTSNVDPLLFIRASGPIVQNKCVLSGGYFRPRASCTHDYEVNEVEFYSGHYFLCTLWSFGTPYLVRQHIHKCLPQQLSESRHSINITSPICPMFCPLTCTMILTFRNPLEPSHGSLFIQNSH